jgi:endonuclease YncB( thermonuclease family)
VPFLVIQGTFHLVGRSAAGAPFGFEPDGDSIQFRPKRKTLLNRLRRVGQPWRTNRIGSTQLRLEGIDALEIHFATDNGPSTHQPRALADLARDQLTGMCGLNPVPYEAPDGLRVDPPVTQDRTPGYILTRSLDAKGRPVAFAFAGTPDQPDGSEVFLTPPLLRRSFNYRSLADGHVYPLFYDTLFADLRDHLADAAIKARESKKGLWKHDRSQGGVLVTSSEDLEQRGVIFPKVFRRLVEFLSETQVGLDAFPTWLARTEEPVLDLGRINFTHFDDVVDVRDGRVRLTRRPEELIFISAKSASPTAAPWLGV